MERYDYREAMKVHVKLWLEENEEYIMMENDDYETAYEYAYDNMWISDQVTGNASGSFYFNSWKAEEAIAHNLDLLCDAIDEFGARNTNILEHGAEWCDVTIRCYLLGEVLSEIFPSFYYSSTLCETTKLIDGIQSNEDFC